MPNKFIVLDTETGKAPDAEKFYKDFEFKPSKKKVVIGSEEQGDLFLKKKPKWVDDAEYKKQYAIHMSECDKWSALSPFTAQILAYGILECEYPIDKTEQLLGANIIEEYAKMQRDTWNFVKLGEKELLEQLIVTLIEYSRSGHIIVGKRLKYFDLPMIFQRCMKHRVKITSEDIMRIHDKAVDIEELWFRVLNGRTLDYQQYSEDLSIDRIGRFLGNEATKDKDIQKNFHKYFLENPDLARAYLLGDLYKEKFIFERLKPYAYYV